MVKKAPITLHIASPLRGQAATLFDTLSGSLSTAAGIFYRQAPRHRAPPFEMRLDGPNETAYVAMQAAGEEEELCGPL